MNRVQSIGAAETVARNLRAFRQLRGLDQSVLARRMDFLGFGWRQVTVSEVEREHRNVTVEELLALAFVLGTTVEQLLDPRGPERIRGPWMSLSGFLEVDPAEAGAIPPHLVAGLVCTHADPHPAVEWDDDSGAVTNLNYVTDRPR